MRVGSISSVYSRSLNSGRVRANNSPQKSCSDIPVENKEVNFKGNFGKIVGGVIGTGAVVAASFVVAPAIICMAGAGLVAGMVAGDVAEDKINKEGDYKKG